MQYQAKISCRIFCLTTDRLITYDEYDVCCFILSSGNDDVKGRIVNLFEEYYEKLPDVDRYLERIGMQRPKSLNKAYLDELVLAHQCTVPFENLDIYELHKPISIIPRDLFDKVVVRKRGGYCFELNGVFVLLLQALGYDAYSCPCRGARPGVTVPQPVRHRGNIVRLDGKYLFCDVGYGGPMPPGSIVVEDGTRQVVNGETFWFEQIDEFSWLLKRLTKGKIDMGMSGNTDGNDDIHEASVMYVSQSKWEPVDFIPGNLACSDGPDASFAQRRMLNLRRRDGHIAITGNLLTTVKNGVKQSREISDEEAARLAREEFGLIL